MASGHSPDIMLVLLKGLNERPCHIEVLPVLFEGLQKPKCLKPHSGIQNYTFYTQHNVQTLNGIEAVGLVVFCFWF